MKDFKSFRQNIFLFDSIIYLVIRMRTFYLYQINDFCVSLYEQSPYKLYHILKDIYYTSKYNQSIAISSYEQITDKFSKQFLHDYIFNYYRLELYYHGRNHVHTISNHYEYSKLMVSCYSLKLKTSISYPSFFGCLNQFSSNIFVCDFENQDYFWLGKVVKNEKSLVNQ